MTPETRLKLRVKKLLCEEHNEGVWFYKSSDRFTAGIPDILGCYWGLFFGIELKAPGKEATTLQQITHQKIREAGGFVISSDNYDEIRKFLEEIKQYGKRIQQMFGRIKRK